jgi:hypothetical protein
MEKREVEDLIAEYIEFDLPVPDMPCFLESISGTEAINGPNPGKIEVFSPLWVPYVAFVLPIVTAECYHGSYEPSNACL